MKKVFKKVSPGKAGKASKGTQNIVKSVMQSDQVPFHNIDINESLARKLVVTQFPQWADLPIKSVKFGGWDNRTFRLGEKMSLRLPSAAPYAAQVEKEQHWLPKLAPFLPLPIPTPLAMGNPDKNYPWHWSIYQWIEGENATIESIEDLQEFAITLAHFLAALQNIDSAGGPKLGRHNFFRGGSLNIYDAETRTALIALSGKIDTDLATEVWEGAIRSKWHSKPVWLHGDVAPSNLLVKNGRLNAIIDFGCSGVGDPACDLTIAWTLFSGASREAFFTALPLDGATWARARGWALWKALITLAETIETDIHKSKNAKYRINEVLEDYKRAK
jgi:aminoglycoside phosphotransferase (APT) family kinase protein